MTTKRSQVLVKSEAFSQADSRLLGVWWWCFIATSRSRTAEPAIIASHEAGVLQRGSQIQGVFRRAETTGRDVANMKRAGETAWSHCRNVRVRCFLFVYVAT